VQVGVFGGTFDPVHWGHLVLAEEALTGASLDRILFVPSGLPPHKTRRPLTPLADRSNMLRLALEGVDRFELSEIEAEREGPHYTLETLEHLSAARPADSLSFILGSDSLLELGTWHRPEEIVERWPIVVLARPGFDPEKADPRFTKRMTVIDTVSVAVSSTLIRSRIRSGSDVRFLVPSRVLHYARTRKLYEGTAR
jgi:nicotinate-nucleotide adenylyltransferase